MRKLTYLLAFVLFILCLSVPQMAVEQYSIILKAHPQAIVADSVSTTTISAEVLDVNARPVADGTVVEFTSSLGVIERTATTMAGTARVRLQSNNTPGTAIVSAVVASGNAIGKLNVDFLEPGTEMFDESFILVESNSYLGFDAKKMLIDAAGGVKIVTRGLTIEADSAQMNARTNIMRAAGRIGGPDIILSRGDKHISASVLYYDFNRMSGVLLLPAADGAARMKIRGSDLFTEPDLEPKQTETFNFDPITNSSMFIKARNLIIRPGDDIKIKKATVYVEGEKVLSVPLHVIPLGSNSAGADRLMTYGTDGLRLDLPIYYSLSAHQTGAFRVKHSEPTQWGYYSGRSGWQVDLEQDYNLAGSVNGQFTLNHITSNNWGASWNHRVEYNNNSQLYTFLDFPAHKGAYGTLDYRRVFQDFNLSAFMRANKQQNLDGRINTGFGLQTKSKSLVGDAITYSLFSNVSYASQNASTQKVDTGAGVQLYGKTIRFGSQTSLSSSATIGRNWGGLSTGTSVYANAGLYHTIGMIGQCGLNYTYNWANSLNAYTSQRLSADVSLRPSSLWDTRVYVTRGLLDGSTSAFGELNIYLAPTWKLGVFGTYQRFKSFQNYAYTDTEYTLSKIAGGSNLKLVWSQVHKRMRFEFSPLSW